jgi:predicted dehydrogenase
MVKAIQVGVGRWGYSWATEVIPKVPGIEMVAYVDPSADALQRIRDTLGVAPGICFPSLAEAAKAVEADLVIATLRTPAHRPVVGEALDMGFNVIVEKPFASNMAEAKELVRIAESRSRLLMVSQNYRFHAAPILAAELIGAEKHGPVEFVAVDFRRHSPSQGHSYLDMPDPLLADMSIHHFDLMRMVLGDNPRRISARTWNPPGSPFTNHPIGVAMIEFEKGTTVSYRGSFISPGPTTPWAGEWAIDCTQAQIWWTSRDHIGKKRGADRLEVRSPQGTPEEAKLTAPPFVDRQGTLDAVVRVIETGAVPPRFSSGRDDLTSFALTVAAITSAGRNGDWVEIAEIMA